MAVAVVEKDVLGHAEDTPFPPARPPVISIFSWSSTPSHSTTLRTLKAPPLFIVHGKEREDKNGYTEYV